MSVHVSGLCIGGPLHGTQREHDSLTMRVAVPDEKPGAAFRLTEESVPIPEAMPWHEGEYRFTEEFGVTVSYGFGSVHKVQQPCWVYVGEK